MSIESGVVTISNNGLSDYMASYRPYNSGFEDSSFAPSDGVSVNTKTTRPHSILTPRPSSHRRLALFSCLCCCVPLGIAALVYSVKCQHAKDASELALAERHSKSTRDLAHASIFLGLSLLLLGLLVGLLYYFTLK